MPIVAKAYLDAEIGRFLRPDAYRWLRHDWRRHVRGGSDLEKLYERIERKYRPDQARVPAGVPEGGQWADANGRSLNGGRSRSMAGSGPEILGRAPRGPLAPEGPSDSGAQSKREADSTTGSGAVDKELQIAGRISPQRRAECEEQLRLDEFICRTVGTSRRWGRRTSATANA